MSRLEAILNHISVLTAPERKGILDACKLINDGYLVDTEDFEEYSSKEASDALNNLMIEVNS